MIRTLRLLSLCTLWAALFLSPARGFDLIDVIDAGQEATPESVHEALRALNPSEVEAFVDSVGKRRRSVEATIRKSAADVLELVRAFPAEELAHIGRTVEAPDSATVAERCLEVIRVVGRDRELPDAAEWTAWASKLGLERGLRAKLTTTVGDVRSRGTSSSNGFLRGYETVPRGLVPAWIDALRQRSTPSDQALACQLLGVRPRYDAIVLNRLHAISQSAGSEAAAPFGAVIREYLQSTDARCRREAARLVGLLRDADSIELLVNLSIDSDVNVRRAAHSSLQRLTGMRFGASPRRWLEWHRAEAAWWTTRGERMVKELGSTYGAALLDTLNEMAQHALYRNEIGKAVQPLLKRKKESVVLMSLSVLESTRCVGEAPAVLALTAHPNAGVARQARAVYRSLTRDQTR